MFYTIYRVTNLLNNKEYIGKHKTKNINDNYLGSGRAVIQAIRKHGKENFLKEILFVFDNEREMNLKEEELVTLAYINQCNTYNMSVGGKGGFDFINRNKHKYPNCMLSEDTKRKMLESRARNLTEERRLELIEISKKNLAVSHKNATGRKRPEHAAFMIQKQKTQWENDEYREKIRDSKSGWYLVISPVGAETRTNRLGDFCKTNNLPYVTMYSSVKRNLVITKGKAKNWQCKKIYLT